MSVYTISFGKNVLRAIGAPYNVQTDRFFRAWAQAEGSRARHNPFATTQRMTGSTTTLNPNGTPNSHGVQDYVNWQQGVEATVKTLLNGRYPGLVKAIRAGQSALAMSIALKGTPWGTGGLAEIIVRSGRIKDYPIGSCYPVRPPFTKRATPRVANGQTVHTSSIVPGDTGADVDEVLRRVAPTMRFYVGDAVQAVAEHQRRRWPLLGKPDGIIGPLTYRSITGHP